MRDYVLVGFVLASIPVGLLQPYYALLVYAWISYMYPHMYTWGFAQTFPSAKLMAFTAVAGAVLQRDIDLTPLRRPAMILMMMLLGWFTVSTFFALYPDDAWARWQDVCKVLGMAMVSSVFLTTQRRMRMFLLVITFSLAFYGIKGGLFSLGNGGEEMVGGAGTSVVAANNAIGLALNMCLPFLWYLAQEERGWIKRFFQAGFFLTVPAIMFTYSRASAITLAVMLPLLFLRGRRAGVLLVFLVIGGLLAYPLIPDKWWNRQETTTDYDQDASAMSRIDNWKICWRIALDHPIVGLGFEFMSNELYAQYSPEYIMTYGKAFNTHSIYLAMLGSHGFPGFFLFMGMIGLTYSNCWWIRRRVRHRPDLQWCATYCRIVTASLFAFLLNGAFANMEYFDLPYHLVAVAACLNVICARALATESDDIVQVPATLSAIPAV